MNEQYDPFELWENEQSGTEEGLMAVQRSLDLAKELQYDLSKQPLGLRKDMGMEALKLVTENHADLRHHTFAVHVQHAYLHVKQTATEQHEHTRKYGEMRLIGQIGYYILQEFNEVEFLLSLQLFEPKQLHITHERDRIATRLSEPLTLPVAGIIAPPVLIK